MVNEPLTEQDFFGTIAKTEIKGAILAIPVCRKERVQSAKRGYLNELNNEFQLSSEEQLLMMMKILEIFGKWFQIPDGDDKK
jgi:hypothetical protein